MKQALLLIDIQNDYFPGGAMELSGSLPAGMQAGKLLRLFRDKSLPIIHIQHLSTREGATFFVPNTGGVEIHETVAPSQVRQFSRRTIRTLSGRPGFLSTCVGKG